jgi:hypothetical protein
VGGNVADPAADAAGTPAGSTVEADLPGRIRTAGRNAPTPHRRGSSGVGPAERPSATGDPAEDGDQPNRNPWGGAWYFVPDTEDSGPQAEPTGSPQATSEMPDPTPASHASPAGVGLPDQPHLPESENTMTDHNTALKGAMEIEGALGVALVDSGSGMALGTAGSPMDLDLEVAAAGNSTVVQAKLRTMADLGLQQSIEDILITLDKQYHIIRPLSRQNTLFLYLVLDRARANLAMARFRLAALEKDLKV